ncbi:MAG TPA: helix-turn-helix transcriptional regulator [Burkholderiaceae bacterium]
MSTPERILHVLRAHLRAAGITYGALAPRIGMSESSVKRLFSQNDMPLSRLAAICQAAGVALEDVLREAADAAPAADTLSLVQEKALVDDPKLLLVATCCLGNWTLEQVAETYAMSEAEGIVLLAALDRLGLIVLRPLNRYSLRVSHAFHWLPDGPVQRYFRSHIVADYFDAAFDGAGEMLMCVPARLSRASAMELSLKMRQLASELASQHQHDRKLSASERDGYTMLLGLRSWEFGAFTALRRAPA